MKNLTIFIVLFLSLFFHTYGQIKINLSGTIVTQAKYPANDIVVALKNTGLRDTTGKDGKFEVVGEISPILNGYAVSKPKLRCLGNQLLLEVTQGRMQLSLHLYNAKGAKVLTIFDNRTLSRGQHRIPLLAQLRTMSSSVFIAVLTQGTEITKYRIVKTGGNRLMVHDFNKKSTAAQYYQKARALSVLDSLLFIRYRTVEGKAKTLKEYALPVSKWIDKFEVTLDMIPYEAVELGLAEYKAGRVYPEQVGKNISEYPGPLVRYLRKTGSGVHDYEAWCSEFHSWIMRVTGYPFGDDEGSAMDPHWMVDAHTRLETWYTRKAKFVKKSQITSSGYYPVPGDFIHLNAHTATVRYMDGNTIHCLDGNWGNKIKIPVRGDYRTLKPGTTLHGYGRRSGVVGCSHKSISEE